MSALTIHLAGGGLAPLLHTQDPTVIAAELAKIGVGFERWTPRAPLPASADDAAVLAAYDADIKRLMVNEGYQSVDVVRLFPDNEKRVELRQKFLSEHTHAEDEVRFFVEGTGIFYIHADGKVHQTLCAAGDFIRLPANLRHWFDMGPAPLFTAIRLFTSPDGWVAEFTGDAIADRFPKYEQVDAA